MPHPVPTFAAPAGRVRLPEALVGGSGAADPAGAGVVVRTRRTGLGGR